MLKELETHAAAVLKAEAVAPSLKLDRTDPAGRVKMGPDAVSCRLPPSVVERPVSVLDFLATVCLALGIDYEKTNLSNVGRPIRIVDQNANPIREVIS